MLQYMITLRPNSSETNLLKFLSWFCVSLEIYWKGPTLSNVRNGHRIIQSWTYSSILNNQLTFRGQFDNIKISWQFHPPDLLGNVELGLKEVNYEEHKGMSITEDGRLRSFLVFHLNLDALNKWTITWLPSAFVRPLDGHQLIKSGERSDHSAAE